MTIEVTPGHASAVAFVTATDADAYFTARGITKWTGTEAEKEASLVRGADFLERTYAGLWVGSRAETTQALSWPRTSAKDAEGVDISSTVIPEQIKRANLEAAYLVITGVDLAPAFTAGIVEEKDKAGAVETMSKYGEDGAQPPQYLNITRLLTGLVKSSASVGVGFAVV